MDDHDEDYIKRLVDFLLEINLDLAEFTIMTPFPHTPIRATLEEEKGFYTMTGSGIPEERLSSNRQR